MKVPPNFIYPDLKPEDYIFGSGQVIGNILRSDGDWRNYLPPAELQRRNGVESSACFIEAQQHAIATIIEEQFDMPDKNFSARFNLIFADATTRGGDPIKGAQTFRDKGLIPEEMLPFSTDIHEWMEFRSFKGANEQDCLNEGKKWLDEWDVHYDVVVRREYGLAAKYLKLKDALHFSPICVSVAQGFDNGKQKPAGLDDTHLVELVYIDENNVPYVWDTYGPNFLKKLSANYSFDFGIRWTVERKTKQAQISILVQILQKLQEWLNLLKGQGMV